MTAATLRRAVSSARTAPCSGLTLIELLAVVALLIFLAFLLVPLSSSSSVMANQQKCGKNQSQIMGACVAYAQQEETAWPAPWPTTVGYAPRGQAIAAGIAAMNYTFGCFEVLAHEARLPNGLFRCPNAASPGPNTHANPFTRVVAPPGTGSWGDDGGGSRKRIGYAFDWAAPADPSSVRIVFCDRDPANHKRKGVMTCYGDSHTRFLKARSGPPSSAAPNETIGMSQANVVVGEVDASVEPGVDGATPADQLPDNIFNSAGDVPAGSTEAETVLTPGGGGTNRVFVK
jgi:type II secretory pathway pseudopilin PulG